MPQKAFILFGIIVVLTGLCIQAVYSVNTDPQPKTQQPVFFSHLTHSGKEKIACLYCHIYVERSSVAGVPSMQKCIGCHEMIATEDPEVKKLLDYWDRREPIPWKKIYHLPDYVYFSHRMHVNAEVECGKCHGNVSEMEEVEKVSSLSMGWCLDCHKKMEAPVDCNVCHK